MRKALLLLLLCIPLTVGAASKGLKIVVQDQSGKSIPLYGDSHALLIGVSEYQATDWTDLESIPSELATVEKVLIEQGFNVQKHLNPNGKELKSIFQSFIDKYGYDPENRLLFFFSGHGWTKENGKKGYLVPADAPNPEKDQTNFLRKALPMSQVLAWARQTEAKHSLYLFDSCFSGAIFQTKSLPDKPPHITEATSLPVRQFITAGKANELVPSQSTFTPTFVDALKYGFGDLNKDGYVSGTELGLYLQEKVPRFVQQTPQFGKIQQYDLSRGDFIFVLPKASKVAISSPSATTSVDTSAIEIAFWNSIEDSKNLEMFEAYLKKYPAGDFSLLAKIELKAISDKAALPTPSSSSSTVPNSDSLKPLATSGMLTSAVCDGPSKNSSGIEMGNCINPNGVGLGRTSKKSCGYFANHYWQSCNEYLLTTSTSSSTDPSSNQVFCATVSNYWSTDRITCSNKGGKAFESEYEAKAKYKRLRENASLVWCATTKWFRYARKSSCRIDGGTSYSNRHLAQAEHKRLKAASSTTSSSSSSEVLFWKSVKDSNDPDSFKAYLRKFPQGVFAGLAKLRIKKLGSDTTTASSSSSTASNSSSSGLKIVRTSPKYNRQLFGDYYALVIGNNRYEHLRDVRTAVNDASAVSIVLQSDYGFNVTLLQNATRHQILGQLNRFRDTLGSNDNLLIFYAGHSYLDWNTDDGYWLPVDASGDDPSSWMMTEIVTSQVRAMKAKHVMVVADSAFSGVLVRGLKLGGLKENLVKRKARTVLTSGGLEPVMDSGGSNSVFASSFLSILRDNDGVLDASQLFSQLRPKVMMNADQTPEYGNMVRAGHDGGDFLFVRQ